MNPKLLHRSQNRQNYATSTRGQWLSFLIRLSLVLSPFFLIDVSGLLSTSRISTQTSFRTSSFLPPHYHNDGFNHDHQRRHRHHGRDKRTIICAATTDNQNDDDINNQRDETDMNWNDPSDIEDASTPSTPLPIDETSSSIANNNNYHVIKKNNPKSKRKPPSDNRDQLPFVVQLITPDPYTRPEVAKERARKNTERDRQQQQQQQMRRNTNSRRSSAAATPRISASLFETTKSSSNDDAPTVTALGEFILDQSTTCGDIVVVGEQSYLVQTAKCQYKYAGGKRFDMVRKILHVKPIRRVQVEAVLQRSLQQTSKYFEDGKEEDDPIMLE
ncbi:hypothetical protein MHU86_5495 [Fragilaria crotonensis]|nr:hypothetical protein MHU86_5495 [Fragilaria crotonensis]